MASKLSGIELTRYDDLFKTDAEREADRQERIQIVPAAEVFPYSRQPYTIDRPTPDLVRLMDSIEHIGIADRVGSLEEGKDADVVIVDGCPFDVTGVIKHVLINGEEV